MEDSVPGRKLVLCLLSDGASLSSEWAMGGYRVPEEGGSSTPPEAAELPCSEAAKLRAPGSGEGKANASLESFWEASDWQVVTGVAEAEDLRDRKGLRAPDKQDAAHL